MTMQLNDEETYFNPKTKEIDLMEIFQILKQQIWVVFLSTIIFTGLGFWYSSHHKVTLQYQSTTRLVLNATTDQMNTLLVMFTDPSILTEVSKQIGLKRSPGLLASEITVTNINSSQIIDLQVTDSNPYLAEQIANKDVQVFMTEVPKV
jgi:capsular polysaccharide biosynthesis protein